jgi:hypothetical protein
MLSRPPGDSLRRFLRRLPVAILVAAAVWGVVKRPYNVVLCQSAEAVARQTEYPRAALVQADRDHAVLGRVDLRTNSGRLRISLTQVTFNLIPFLALVLAMPGALRRGGWKQLLFALPILALSHLLAVVIQLRCFYAFSLGEWSMANYSDLARNVYGGLRYFFDLPVTFCLPLLLWVGAFPGRVQELVGMESKETPATPRAS